MDYKEEMDPYLEEIGANLDNFIENINCLRETAQGGFSVDSPSVPHLTKYRETAKRMSHKSVTFALWQGNIHHSTTRH